MVNTCVVNGCHNRADDKEKRKFFSIPAVRLTEGERTEELSRNRRLLWISRIYRKNFEPSKYSKVCSEHFVTGDKVDLYSYTHPDWAPSLKMQACDRVDEKETGSLERHKRQKVRHESWKQHEAANALLDLHSTQSHNLQSVSETTVLNPCTFTMKGRLEPIPQLSTESDRECVTKVTEECQRLISENAEFRNQLSDQELDILSFKDNDKKVHYYTGLPNFLLLSALFELLEPSIPHSSRIKLSKFKKLLIVLMRLKLNTPIQDIAYRFSIATSTVSRTFLLTIHIMYVKLKEYVYWPDRAELHRTMPMTFRNHFGLKVAVIIDCFEVFIERPSNLLARAESWSSYKHHNTVKFLIGITPQGCISYISDAYGGRASDKHITDHCGFLNKLNPGDVVLADRGFNIAESVGLMCAQVVIPNFTKGKSQLSPYEVANTRKIAHVRIHVERVIGLLRNKYTILSGKIPIDYLMRNSDEVPAIDKIATVCCALTNMCKSVIPFN